MIVFYSAIIFIAVVTQIVMLEIVGSDILLPADSKKGFLMTLGFLMVITISEWIAVFIGNLNNGLVYVQHGLLFIIMVLAPVVPVLLSGSILNINKKWLLYFMLISNFIIQTNSLFDGSVFYIDSENEFQYGPLYGIYILIFLFCYLQLYYNIYKFGKNSQTRNNYVLILIIILGASANFIQMFNSEVLVIWIDATIITILTYVYYNAVINQLDPVSHLLQRRCYENMLININDDAVIILFDVNNFKEVNDIDGHSAGDFVLGKIGDLIKETYAKDGLGYRIGGDEFCVILKRNLRFVEELNEDFERKLIKAREEDERIPTVAVGYAEYIYGESNIIEVTEKADMMMYKDKNKKVYK